MGKRICIRQLNWTDLEDHLKLRIENRNFLQPFEPQFTDHHYTLAGQREVIRKVMDQWETGASYGFGVYDRDTDQLIGRVNLSNVSRGAWQNCTIGYFLDQECLGKGYMTEAVRLACGFAFQQAGLHRIEASVMPRNTPSIRVLEKVGFQYIGLSKHHLKINGVWEDHHLYSLTAEMVEWTRHY